MKTRLKDNMRTVADIVKGSKVSNFSSYREGVFYYVTDNDFYFTIPLEDVTGATLAAQDKTIFFMRWIRKQLEANELALNS